MSKISLRKNFLHTLSGNVAYGFAQWAMLMIIAKLGTPEMVGRFALALAVTAPIVRFANMNLRAVLATDVTSKRPFSDYLGLRLVMLAGAMLVIALSSLGYDRRLFAVVLAIGLAKGFESISDLHFGLMQQHERMDRIARSLLYKSLVTLVLFFMGMYLTRDIFWGSICLVVAWSTTLVTFDRANARDSLEITQVALAPSFDPAALKRLAMTALPLGFADLLVSLLINVPRYFVKGMLGDRELGFFAATAYLTVVGARVITALGESSVPRLARCYEEGDADAFQKLLVNILLVGIFIGAAGLLVGFLGGKPLLTLLYRPEYAERLDAFNWLMLAGAISYVGIFLSYAMTASQAFWAQPVIVTAGFAVTALGCMLLIPRYGLVGAAMAIAFCNVTQLFGKSYVVWRILRELKEKSRRERQAR